MKLVMFTLTFYNSDGGEISKLVETEVDVSAYLLMKENNKKKIFSENQKWHFTG